MGDDFYSRQLFCQALLDHHLHFILVCKPESHEHLLPLTADPQALEVNWCEVTVTR